MNLPRSTLKIFASNTVNRAIGFIGIVFFARELGATQMGIFFLFQSLVGILAIPANLGFGEAVEKRISEDTTSAENLLSTAVTVKLTLLIQISVSVLVLHGPINNYLGMDLAVFLIFVLFLQQFSQLTMKVLNGELRVGETALPLFLNQLTWVGIGAILVIMGFGVYGMVYGLLAGFAVMLAFGVYKISTRLGRPSVQHVKLLFEYAKYSFVSSVGIQVFSWTDVLIIGLFLQQAFVGGYEIAWRVSGTVLVFTKSLGISIFPQISKWDSEENHEKIEELIPRSMTPALYLVVPAFFGALLFPREILELVFGEEYTLASAAFVILMSRNFLVAPSMVFSRLIKGMDRPEIMAYSTGAGVVLNVILNVILIWKFGLIGAAVATVIATGVRGVLIPLVYLSRVLSVRIRYREVAWCFVAALGMAGVLMLVRDAMAVDSTVKLFSVVALGAVIYFMLSMLYAPLRDRILNSLRYAIT